MNIEIVRLFTLQLYMKFAFYEKFMERKTNTISKEYYYKYIWY